MIKAMKLKLSMLEYMKMILSKVSFERRLFRKEYRKSLCWLSAAEASELKAWLREQKLATADSKIKHYHNN
jgi:hypothetical protein